MNKDMNDYKALFDPDGIYHVYNRANGKDVLFSCRDNYQYFIKKYLHYIQPVADTFCYCLLPTHFHFLIRVKGEALTLTSFNTRSGLEPDKCFSNHISKQFSHIFNGYAQAYNKQQGRSGSLFARPFNRKRVNDEKYLINLVRYIHNNPIEAGLCKQPEKWKYSSYQEILSDDTTWLAKDDVIDWFDTKDNFIYCHTQPCQGFNP